MYIARKIFFSAANFGKIGESMQYLRQNFSDKMKKMSFW